MSRYLCIHGHFYQPPRESPWLEVIELQDSAYPYHDWNEKITAECYAPNTASRILDPEARIIDITNNYGKISFNFGPTLLSWMDEKSPDTLKGIIAADREPKNKFSGHPPAIAQAYNHMIMPLANARDKRTQVIWGEREFQRRFARKPESMWLPETAVDLECLDILAEHGMKFVILAPTQIGKVRKIGDEVWTELLNGSVDPRMPYLCNLPSGRSISIFPYDGEISKDIAFKDLLNNGETFADSLIEAFSEGDADQIVHVATDGETYGHHHPKGDMALAYCLYHIESKGLAHITTYGEYLEKHPPTHEVEIIENTSWSCAHGIERWKSDCGDNSGGHPEWNQAWRGPLRQAMDWLRDQLIPIYEREAAPYLKDPWKARDDYIEVILDRSIQNVSKFLSEHSVKDLSQKEKVKALKLLGMQRQALLMYTSCGWFFDEISGIETTQVMKYAARAMQLAKEVTGIDLEPDYKKILKGAKSNIQEFENGEKIYDMFIKPSEIDLTRVTAHYAISSLFAKYPTTTQIYSYTVNSLVYDLEEHGEQRLAIGKVDVSSILTWEEETLSFAVVSFEGHYLNGGVQKFSGEEQYDLMRKEIKEAFSRSDLPGVIRLMDKHFGDHNFGFWHLFKDEQRRIFQQIMESHLEDIDRSFKQTYDHDYPIMQVMKDIGIPLPETLAVIRRSVLNSSVRDAIINADVDNLKRLVEEIKRWPVDLDSAGLSLKASRKVEGLMEELLKKPDDPSILSTAGSIISALNELRLEPKFWKPQNILFSLSKQQRPGMRARADKGDEVAKTWLKEFESLEGLMHVRTP